MLNQFCKNDIDYFLVPAVEVMEFLHIPKGVRRVLFRTLDTAVKLMFLKYFCGSRSAELMWDFQIVGALI